MKKSLSLVHQQYNMLDVMKFVMAIIVVAIHTRPERSFNSPFLIGIFELIYSIAVPFFFMTSGFLLFRKITLPLDAKGEMRIKSYIKRICKLYLIWTLIYLPLSIYGFILDGMPILKTIAVFFRNILLIGENYMSWPLWYLLALIVAVGIIYLLLKIRVSVYGIVAISVLMALVGFSIDYCKENAIMQPVTDLYFSVFQKTRNGFFVGMLYVALGLLCSRIEKISMMGGISLFMIGIIGMISKLPLANAFIVFSIFILSVSVESNHLTIDTSEELRVMSSIIYFVHMLLMAVLVLFAGLTHGILLFLIVTFLALIMCRLLLRYRDNKMFRMLFS